ncbi:MAG: amino acid permease [Myxococcales bacterium]|nr:MAG: amino acid permease [Myxococcales bacterium]
MRIDITAEKSVGDALSGQAAMERVEQISMSASPKLGLASGIGLVIANMVGAGVFLSAGFMAQDLGPGPILIAWVVGMVLALCGALSYATLAEWVPRSGGEYRYLSELMHPALGYLAGYGSMLLGFSGPVAIDAISRGVLEDAHPGRAHQERRHRRHRRGHRATRRQSAGFEGRSERARRSQDRDRAALRGGGGRLWQLRGTYVAAPRKPRRIRLVALHGEPVLHRICVQRLERGRLRGRRI